MKTVTMVFLTSIQQVVLPDQYDDDQDLIDNTVDLCKATPAGEQVDANGCAESQKRRR